MHLVETEVIGHLGLRVAKPFTNVKQLLTQTIWTRPPISHQELPPDAWFAPLKPALFLITLKYCLRILSLGSRMGLLTIAAASTNLLNSPAMLITRQGGRLSYALAVA